MPSPFSLLLLPVPQRYDGLTGGMKRRKSRCWRAVPTTGRHPVGATEQGCDKGNVMILWELASVGCNAATIACEGRCGGHHHYFLTLVKTKVGKIQK